MLDSLVLDSLQVQKQISLTNEAHARRLAEECYELEEENKNLQGKLQGMQCKLKSAHVLIKYYKKELAC